MFAGSSPDDDEGERFPGQELLQPSSAINIYSRFRHSPPRATDYTQSKVEVQAQTLRSNQFDTNGVFAPKHGYDNSRESCFNNGPPPLNGSAVTSSQSNGYTTTSGPIVREQDDYSSRVPAPTPMYETGRDLCVNAEGSQPWSSRLMKETVRSMGELSLDRAQEFEGGAPIYSPHRTSVPHSQPQHPREVLGHPATTDVSVQPSLYNRMEGRFHPSAVDAYSAGGQFDHQAGPHYGSGRGTLSQLTNDYRSNLHSPLYSAADTPPTGPQSVRSTPASGVSSRTSHNETVMGNRKFHQLDNLGFDHPQFAPNPMQTQTVNDVHYDFHRPARSVRMNPLANPYIAPVHSGLIGYPAPRMPSRESDQNQIVRSPLLEAFRASSKTNRRFELKDIYNHIVEFSGDQHASRFIQQKLETANSDEKEQVFKEIQPNVLQLMTDVFGNYVIQKMFEHGNQSQKKVLANQMKGHVLTLSTQMYGCRVVQKAFEHVLTDQQASLVKELDGPGLQILRVVKDQNGNHVIQKAIERIPGEHIQFIVDAHRGQVVKMSTHQYGCRVVQRMLEFCQPAAKRVILGELLEHTLPLISDSYGNYVVQHIIENGEPRDRRQVIHIVLQQLLTFSKHKFASNIVEKSIDYADADQRVAILHGLTAADENGVTPVLGLMKDQYGNYVLRECPHPNPCLEVLTNAEKVHARLQGAELLALEAEMKRNYPILTRITHGKQVIAMEKLLFCGNGPSTSTASIRSSTLPSTNTSSSSGDVEGTPGFQG